MGNQQYCTAACLDISQVFDKAPRATTENQKNSTLKLLQPAEIRRILPSSYSNLLKSYLNGRQFETKFNGEISSRFHIHSGVPQGGTFGPLLYVLYTSDLATFRDTTLGTFAGDSAIFTTHEDPTIVSLNPLKPNDPYRGRTAPLHFIYLINKYSY